MELTDNLMAFVERKLFTLNTGHAITAYHSENWPGTGRSATRFLMRTFAVVKGAMEERRGADQTLRL